jgi:transcriptional regulator with XRE-family HTH domain
MEHLTAYLEAAGKSQAAFARDAGLSRSYMCEIMAGTKVPGRDAIGKIARASGGAIPPSAWFEDAA